MAKGKKGRPAGSKYKNKAESVITGKRKPGRPPGKKRGRPSKSLLAGGHSVNRIHFIGDTLVIYTRQMSIEEVVFLGKPPKVR
jgi:hypothetical protein